MANKRYTRVVYILSQYLISMQRIERCMDELCKWKQREAILGEDAVREVMELINAEAASAAKQRSVAEALMATVTDERQRLILRMRFYDGMKLEQIAERLHLDERWVFRLQSRAMEQMLQSPLLGE